MANFENPNSSFFAVKMRGKTYDLSHNFLRSLNFHRKSNDYGTLEFIIEDTMDLSLEEQLMHLVLNKQEMLSFQYGWYNGYKSKWYTGFVSDYKPTFHSNAAMQLQVQVIISNQPAQPKVKSYKANAPHEVVQQICKEEGWNLVVCDSTDPFTTAREYTQSNVRSIDFIREKIEPEATSGGVPMQFYLHNDADGTKAYFVKMNHYESAIVDDYIFMINAGNMGQVISFDPSYNATATASAAQMAGLLDSETNELYVYNAEAGAAATQTLAIYNASSPDKMQQLVANRWYEKNIGSYTATLQVYGNPNLEPMRFINIIPFRPDGSIHHTGGVYMITDINDSISEGAFVTNLGLVKAAIDGHSPIPFGDIVKLRALR